MMDTAEPQFRGEAAEYLWLSVAYVKIGTGGMVALFVRANP
jgi:hypothetical protein